MQAWVLYPGLPQLKQVILDDPGAGVVSRAVDGRQASAGDGRVSARADNVKVGIARVLGVQPSKQVEFTY